MLKNITQFKVLIGDQECLFHFDQQCSIGVAKEALFACLKWLGQVEDQAKALEEEKAKEKEEREPEISENKIEQMQA